MVVGVGVEVEVTKMQNLKKGMMEVAVVVVEEEEEEEEETVWARASAAPD
jgi:acyl dehydratase